LFPLATGKDLASLLTCDIRPSQFETNATFLFALSGLATGLQKVHNFTYDTLDLSLIGCHHDIKPKNVLVDGGRFILADFGLSKFKKTDEDSKSMFRCGGDFYLAPECEDYEKSFQHGMIGRSADIWSFGCIIAEVLTYIHGGARAVRDFKAQRKTKISGLTTYTFHAGGYQHKGVCEWLSSLELQLPKPEAWLIRLVRMMLAVEPEARPKVQEVALVLLSITAWAFYEDAMTSINAISRMCPSSEIDMACLRLDCSGDIFQIREDILTELGTKEQRIEIPTPFQTIKSLDALIKLQDELKQLTTLEVPAIRLRTLQIRHLVDQFWDDIPKPFLKNIMSQLETRVASSEDVSFLEESHNSLKEIPMYRKAALLAAIKRATILSTQPVEPITDQQHKQAERNLSSIQIVGKLETCNLAILPLDGSSRWTRCFVEWLYYDGDFNEELMSRVYRITQMFESKKPKEILSLDSIGFYHDATKPAFGLIFPYPTLYREPSNTFLPVTLATVIHDSQNVRNRPLLEDRYRLALALASSVAEFHKVGWVHKCLSSYSVVLFHPGSTIRFDPTCFQSPSIIGFSHSRPDVANAYTRGPQGNEREEYLHPDYTERKGQYEAVYDYYSLGMILLEIGLWMSVVKFRTDGRISTPRTLRDELLMRRVPLLGHAMGHKYYEVVKYCLEGPKYGAERTGSVESSFVLDRLNDCAA
jgi:serine/threonine protein kinase